jgi:hypothetical protein
MSRNLVLCTLLLFLCSAWGATSAAAPVGLAAFSGSETVIDFESLFDSELVTNQFAGLGVIFSGGLNEDPFPDSSIQGNQEGVNFVSGCDTIIATFSAPQNRAGALVAGDNFGNNSIRFEAFLGAASVDSFTFDTGTTILPGGSLPSVFAALEVLGGGFDRLEITRTDDSTAFSLDDFRFEGVPEPTTFVLAAVAFASLLASAPRRRSRLSDAPAQT